MQQPVTITTSHEKTHRNVECQDEMNKLNKHIEKIRKAHGPIIKSYTCMHNNINKHK